MRRSRPARTRGAVVVTAFGILGGCSLFVSVDGLQGSDAGASSDGSIASDGSGDAKADAVGSDGSIVDGGVDSCVFCDDFDDRTSGLGPWTNSTGPYDISTTESKSAPHSVHFHLPAIGPGFAQTNLNVDIPLQNGGVTVDFDVKIASDISSAGGYFNFASFSLNGLYVGSVTANDTNWASDYWVNLPDGGHLQTTYGAGVSPDQGWHHFQYVVVYDEAKGSLRVTFDGVEMGHDTNVLTFASDPVPSDVNFAVGIGENGDLPELDVYIDNVAVHY